MVNEYTHDLPDRPILPLSITHHNPYSAWSSSLRYIHLTSFTHEEDNMSLSTAISVEQCPWIANDGAREACVPSSISNQLILSLDHKSSYKKCFVQSRHSYPCLCSHLQTAPSRHHLLHLHCLISAAHLTIDIPRSVIHR